MGNGSLSGVAVTRYPLRPICSFAGSWRHLTVGDTVPSPAHPLAFRRDGTPAPGPHLLVSCQRRHAGDERPLLPPVARRQEGRAGVDPALAHGLEAGEV